MAAERPARILLVEDDDALAEATATVLRHEGHEVQRVADYELALKHLESDETLDLLLTDIVMPNRVNGIALSRMARLRRPGLKIMYMTAYDLPDAEQQALGPILRKPIPDEQLVAEVDQLLAG